MLAVKRRQSCLLHCNGPMTHNIATACPQTSHSWVLRLTLLQMLLQTLHLSHRCVLPPFNWACHAAIITANAC